MFKNRYCPPRWIALRVHGVDWTVYADDKILRRTVKSDWDEGAAGRVLEKKKKKNTRVRRGAPRAARDSHHRSQGGALDIDSRTGHTPADGIDNIQTAVRIL